MKNKILQQGVSFTGLKTAMLAMLLFFGVAFSATASPLIVSQVADQVIDEDTPTGALVFTVSGDNPISLQKLSSDTTLIPLGNISTSGNNSGNWSVTVTPAHNEFGDSDITLRFTDDNSVSTNMTFNVAVTSVNDRPTISIVSSTTMDEDTVKNMAITVTDVEDAAGSLTVTSSSVLGSLWSNPALLITGSTGSRNLRIAPAQDDNGTATITVEVEDSGGLKATDTLNLTVDAV